VHRYQGGAKPAWILEIEEARATSSGAIGQAEAWAGSSRQQQQQEQEEDKMETKNVDEMVNQRVTDETSRCDAAAAAAAAAVDNEEIVDEATGKPTEDTVTSQQPPVIHAESDVFSPQDLCDVSVESPSLQGHVTPSEATTTPRSEHVTHVTHESVHCETSPVNMNLSSAAPCDFDHDLEVSHTGDVTESSFRRTAEDTKPTDNAIIQPHEHTALPSEQDRRTDVDRPIEVSKALPVTSSAFPATAASQQTTPPTATPVDIVYDGRGKKRHKDDKTKMTQASAEVDFCQSVTVTTVKWVVFYTEFVHLFVAGRNNWPVECVRLFDICSSQFNNNLRHIYQPAATGPKLKNRQSSPLSACLQQLHIGSV